METMNRPVEEIVHEIAAETDGAFEAAERDAQHRQEQIDRFSQQPEDDNPDPPEGRQLEKRKQLDRVLKSVLLKFFVLNFAYLHVLVPVDQSIILTHKMKNKLQSNHNQCFIYIQSPHFLDLFFSCSHIEAYDVISTTCLTAAGVHFFISRSVDPARCLSRLVFLEW